jgi:hypothetical protein
MQHFLPLQATNMKQPKKKQAEKKQHLFDNPFYVSLLFRSLYVICALLFILDFILHRHSDHSWDNLPGFYAIFGFIAYVAIVLTAKQLRKLVKRKEDYYHVDD